MIDMTTIKTIMIVTIAISKQKEKRVGIEDGITWATKIYNNKWVGNVLVTLGSHGCL